MSWPKAQVPLSEVIDVYGLRPLAREGGWWAPGPRTAGLSAILFLLGPGQDGFSALHQLDCAEGWNWLAGAPAELVRLGDGHDADPLVMLDATHPAALVPRGLWQGAGTEGDWSLVSCWCAPAFEDSAFTLGTRAQLVARFPEHAAIVEEYTRD